MYAGIDKFSGDVVASARASTQSLEETIENSSAEETLVVPVLDADGNQHDVLLKARLNSKAGGLQWEQTGDAESTYRNVVAMSQMTSMLHDQRRNDVYEAAIKKAIVEFKELNGRAPRVLDIGTGTGLLAMMAAKAGAEYVTACELFPTMATIASEVTKLNCGSKIRVVAKRSTDLVVGPEGDMKERADILVTEIFDSVLLGEGILPTVRHARAHLLQPGARVVPRAAVVYGRLIESDTVQNFHKIPGELSAGVSWMRNEDAASCTGGIVGLPLHYNQIRPAPHELSEPFELFSFDFQEEVAQEVDATEIENVMAVTCTKSGSLDGVLLYWKLLLDDATGYSTEPNAEPWQDHWTQVVIPIVPSRNVDAGYEALLSVQRSEYNITVRVEGVGESVELLKVKRAKRDEMDSYCCCGIHTLYKSDRLQMLNDQSRLTVFSKAISSAIKCLGGPAEVACLDVSDGSLLGLMAVGEGCARVNSLEEKLYSGMLYSQIARGNRLEGKINILRSDASDLELEDLVDEKKINLLLAEPFFLQLQTLSLWQALNFWYIRSALTPLLDNKFVSVPSKATLKAAVVHLKDLARSHGTVGVINGFDHQPLDNVQDGWQEFDYPYPLWMYEYELISKATTIMEMDYLVEARDKESRTDIELARPGNGNAIVMWVDYEAGTDAFITTGIEDGRPRNYGRQQIRFFRSARSFDGTETVNAHVIFQLSNGEPTIRFSIGGKPL